jgi:hypothetical protein
MPRKNNRTSGAIAAPPVKACRTRDSPRRSRRGPNTNHSPTPRSTLSHQGKGWPVKRARSDSMARCTNQWVNPRASHPASSRRTWVWERMFSQMRGGAKVTVGAISRVSDRTLATCSGQFTVSPVVRAMATENRLSPIHAMGK